MKTTQEILDAIDIMTINSEDEGINEFQRNTKISLEECSLKLAEALRWVIDQSHPGDSFSKMIEETKPLLEQLREEN